VIISLKIKFIWYVFNMTFLAFHRVLKVCQFLQEPHGITSQKTAFFMLFLVHWFSSPWWWRRKVPLKHRFCQEPCGVTFQKTTSNLTLGDLLGNMLYVKLCIWRFVLSSL
jgi:hypothetical protein